MKVSEKFIIHYVFPTLPSESYNIHTHGLFEEFNHKELQLVLPLAQQDAGVILNLLANEIQNGVVYETNKLYKEPFTADYKFVELQDENGKKLNILRLILCDQNGLFPEDDDCDELFKIQYNNVENMQVIMAS